MNINRIIIITTALLLGLFASHGILCATETGKHNYQPAAGYVPDEATAIKIAVAAWEQVYGKKKIEGEKPYKAILEGRIWHVSGTLPRGWKGGVAAAEISKVNGRIIGIWHGK